MEFRNLQTFLCVAKLQSFSKAAEKLGYSQSNVSFQIQQLEQELEVSLFDRSGKKIKITEPGQEFLFYANEIQKLYLLSLKTIKEKNDNNPHEIEGLLKFGSIESISTSILPSLLAEFNQIYPNISLSVITKNRENLIEMLKNNQIDFFFDFNDNIDIPNFHHKILSKEEVAFLGNKPTNKLSLEILSKQRFILTEQGEAYRKKLDYLLLENGIHVYPSIEFSDPNQIIQLIEKNIGISFLPLFCAIKKINENKLFIVETELPKVEMYCQLYYHKNKWISPQINAFLDYTYSYFNCCKYK